MPDPANPGTVKVEKRGERFFVVDERGRPIADSSDYPDAGAAQKVAERVNGAWKEATTERRRKGAPALTEADLEESMRRIYTPSAHPRTRVGEFAKKLNSLADYEQIHTTAGVRVQRHGPQDFAVHNPYIPDDVVGRHKTPEDAAKQALMVHDDVAKRAARIVDANGRTVSRHPSKAEAMRHKKQGERVVGPLEESRLEAALRDLEEGIALPIHLANHPQRSIYFDPRMHPRTRLGEFTQLLNGLHPGATVETPHGFTLKRSILPGHKIVVEWPGGEEHFKTPEVAAAHVIGRGDMIAIKAGALSSTTYELHKDELGAARTAAILKSDYAGMSHTDELLREMRKAHNRKHAAEVGVRGQNESPVAYYFRMHPNARRVMESIRLDAVRTAN